MFAKPIDRDIKGVIKVGQDDNENIRQELEEYVVTKELQKHFRDFFSSYKRGINGNTDKMGVWISGFFGSGKSHFLKILTYLLENKEVAGKQALDYFLEDNKISDPMVVADMKLASNISTDVALFNIDSKSETAGKKSKDAIVNVFLKVFNEMQGFSGIFPYVADLERQLVLDDLYDEFQEKYLEISGKDWVSSRNRFNFYKDKVAKTLVEIGMMSEESAQDWKHESTKPYQISIDRFAALVKDYLSTKPDNHHVVFLVDEIGQYIGEDSELMLNLQTVTEDLGTACKGKVWIVVTSQQDIDHITEIKGNDFSKIQGRFDTRLNLTSANVDEVIKMRILKKTNAASDTLSILYETKETIIRNLILFNDGIEKKLYSDAHNFSEVYPFIPYQFNILASVLTSIRTHGASGKHLSEGERSMLALFKESAESIKGKEDGELVPFNIFYDALQQFLDHSHAGVISRALENDYINPNQEKDNFNVNVLKTLFMIKYVKEIEANLENITSLMVSNLNQDRRDLKENVQAALDVLSRQMLIQKNGDIYIFLTNEEQEINREIESQMIETGEVTKKIAELIFEDIYPEKKYRYPAFNNRYVFNFNQFVDDNLYSGNQNNDFGIKIVTPQSSINGDDQMLRMASIDGKYVYVNLPNDAGFLNEMRASLKIDKYIGYTNANKIPKFDEIKSIKQRESREHKNRAKLFLQEALKEADFYINGDRIQTTVKDFKSRINEALDRVVTTVYHKLSYIDAPKDNIDVRNLLKKDTSNAISLEMEVVENAFAIKEITDFIHLKTQGHSKISLKAIKERFTKAPYGYTDTDIEWIIAKAFRNDQIALIINGEFVSLLSETTDKIFDYVTKRAYTEKLLIEEKEVIPERLKRTLKDVSHELFGTSSTTADTDGMVYEFLESSKKMIQDMQQLKVHYSMKKYPGKEMIGNGIDLLSQPLQMKNIGNIFKYVEEHQDDYLDLADDYTPLRTFFYGKQKEHWDNALEKVQIYEDSKTFIVNQELEELVDSIKSILNKPIKANLIKDLPGYTGRFVEIYADLLEEYTVPALQKIAEAKNRIEEELLGTDLVEKLLPKYREAFQNLVDKAETSVDVAKVNTVSLEADTLKVRFLAEISREKEKVAKLKATDTKEKNQDSIAVKQKTKKHVSIKTINPSTTWQVETEEDVEQYLETLRTRLISMLEEDTIVNIEF